MILRKNNQPDASQEFDVMMCWLNDTPAQDRAKYTIMHTSNEQKAMIKEVVYKVDINTYSRIKEDKILKRNDIFRAKIRTTKPLMIDSYKTNRNTGSIILINDQTKETVAAGMVI